MPEWVLIEKVARNFQPIKTFDKTPSHPIIREYSNIDPLEKQDQNMQLMV